MAAAPAFSMGFDCGLRDAEFIGDFPVCYAERELIQNLKLPRRKNIRFLFGFRRVTAGFQDILQEGRLLRIHCVFPGSCGCKLLQLRQKYAPVEIKGHHYAVIPRIMDRLAQQIHDQNKQRGKHRIVADKHRVFEEIGQIHFEYREKTSHFSLSVPELSARKLKKHHLQARVLAGYVFDSFPAIGKQRNDTVKIFNPSDGCDLDGVAFDFHRFYTFDGKEFVALYFTVLFNIDGVTLFILNPRLQALFGSFRNDCAVVHDCGNIILLTACYTGSNFLLNRGWFMANNFICKDSLAEQLFNILKEELESGDYVPGQKLMSESAIAQKYNVSRLTVRAAIARLSALDYVETKNGEGSFVKKRDNDRLLQAVSSLVLEPQMLNDVSDFRRLIDTECVRLAILKASKEDFQRLYDACHPFRRRFRHLPP